MSAGAADAGSGGAGPAVPRMAPEQALELLAEADAALQRTLAAAPGDRWLAEPSLCTGWTRGHVLAHLARNADALQRLVDWALTGVERPAYDSLEDRNRDIDEGATRPLAEVQEDLARSSEAFAVKARALVGATDLARVRTGSSGLTLPGDQVPWARLREVTLHHADLRAGFTVADAPTEVVAHALAEARAKLDAHPDSPPVTLVVSGSGEHWTLAGGGPEVHGTPAGLLAWLTRGVTEGVAVSGGGRPSALPPWG